MLSWPLCCGASFAGRFAHPLGCSGPNLIFAPPRACTPPSSHARCRGPLVGVDGRPLDLGDADWHTSDARMTKQFALLQAANLEELDKLNVKLRKDYDAAKQGNFKRQRELQAVTSELTTIERVASGTDRSSGPLAASAAAIAETDAKIAEVQEQLVVSGSWGHQQLGCHQNVTDCSWRWLLADRV